MSVHNPSESTLNPSGSSTHSSAQSPNSPNNSQIKSTTGTARTMFGVGIGSSTGLKGLNSGWQVWGAAAPTSRHNTSVAPVANITDESPNDASYRNNLGDGWTTSKPTSGTWEDPGDSPQNRDFLQLETHPPLALHHARQWQATPAQGSALPVPRVDDRSVGQFPPPKYDNSPVKDSAVVLYLPSPANGNSFVGQSSGLPASPGGYEPPLQTFSAVENDLSLGLRGMAVEDDYGTGRHQQQMSGRGASFPIGPLLPAMQQPRPPYGTYPQADFAPYYTNGPGREPYGDYPFAYDTYRGASDPSLYGSPPVSATILPNIYPGVASQHSHPSIFDVHRQQSGPFYDYGAAARPQVSHFFYPNLQAMMYQPPSHSPMLSPQLLQAHPMLHADKKREHSYNLQVVPYSPLRMSPSLYHHPYGAPYDFGPRPPLMMPGSPIYDNNQLAVQVYQPGMRPQREKFNSFISLRSPLLEEFRADRARNWELRDVFGFIVEFSGDQYGSRFIQEKLETATSQEKQKVFDEIVPDNTLQLIQDVFGNYVIQKLIEHGTQIQKTMLFNIMEGHILQLSLQTYGCRVVQKAVEIMLPDQQGLIIKELEVQAIKCVKDANGNHVVQKLIERVSPERLGFVNSFQGYIYDLSTNPYGCRVLKKCLEYLSEEQMRPLLDELDRYATNLMQDQFGNYIIQFVLEHGAPQDRSLIISKLRGQMVRMARHKFASNVCEKALVTADAENRRLLIDEIITPRQDGASPVVLMMKDQFGNYVLQRALSVVEGEQKEALIAKVRPQLEKMRRYTGPYSRHLSSIERLIN